MSETRSDLPDIEEAIEYVEQFEDEHGHPWLKSRHLAEEFDLSMTLAARLVVRLDREDVVEKWNGGNTATYKVTVDDD